MSADLELFFFPPPPQFTVQICFMNIQTGKTSLVWFILLKSGNLLGNFHQNTAGLISFSFPFIVITMGCFLPQRLGLFLRQNTADWVLGACVERTIGEQSPQHYSQLTNTTQSEPLEWGDSGDIITVGVERGDNVILLGPENIPSVTDTIHSSAFISVLS